jgi:hypothetical protein
VTGIFGMNLDSGLQTDPKAFDEVVIISSVLVVAGIVLFVVIFLMHLEKGVHSGGEEAAQGELVDVRSLGDKERNREK